MSTNPDKKRLHAILGGLRHNLEGLATAADGISDTLVRVRDQRPDVDGVLRRVWDAKNNAQCAADLLRDIVSELLEDARDPVGPRS